MKAFIFVLLVIMTGCTATIDETAEKMEGRPENVRAPAYEDMCKRNPNSPLCKE